MQTGNRVKASLLLMIMLLITGHDFIPHSHYQASTTTDPVSQHHHHFHGHGHDLDHDHHGLPDSKDDADNSQENELINFLLSQHQQITHAPLISSAGNNLSIPSTTSILKAVLTKPSQLCLDRQYFLHHYTLFEPDLLYHFTFLSDFSRRGPPSFIS